MIRKLFGKPAAADDVPALESGRLITSVDVGRSGDRQHAELSDADVERIAARVAERLLRGPMTDTVTRVVAEVSERLVREEIARIRAAANKTA